MKLLRVGALLALLQSFIFAFLPQTIEDIIYKNKANPSHLAILIINKNDGSILASHNIYKPFSPASVAKVATSYAALLTLGKDFRWPTQLFYQGKIRHGVLYGNLIVKAYGDPTLTTYNLKSFASRLASYGIRKITGDLIIDRSFFAVEDKISSGFDKNYVSEYNAMPDALMLNDHLNVIKVVPKTNSIAVYNGGDKSFRLINHIKATHGACRGKNAWPKVRFIKEEGSVAVELSGTLSTKCYPFAIKKVLSKPYMSFYYIFKNALKKEGIAFDGGVQLSKTPHNARLLFTHFSHPLMQIVAKTMKKSNNLYARHIFLMLGAKLYGPPATLAKSQRAIKEILGSRGLIDYDDIIINGSGLSRKSRLKAISVQKILDDAYRNFGNEWLNALSIAGVDGTLKKRFRYSIVKRHAFMKTGTLKRAKNIAGFVKGRSGNLYTTVIFYNGAKIWVGKTIQDKIITWLVKTK